MSDRLDCPILYYGVPSKKYMMMRTISYLWPCNILISDARTTRTRKTLRREVKDRFDLFNFFNESQIKIIECTRKLWSIIEVIHIDED